VPDIAPRAQRALGWRFVSRLQPRHFAAIFAAATDAAINTSLA
jgi:hypothetical protein